MAGFGGITQKNFAKPRKAATTAKPTTVKPPLTTPDADTAARQRFLGANDVPDNLQQLIAAAEAPKPSTGDQMRQAFSGAVNHGTGSGGMANAFASGGGNQGATQPGQGDKYDGFASRYVPGERDLLFSNPGIIVQDWLSQGPYKNNPAMAGDLQRYADIVFGSGNQPGLYELLLGGNMGKDGANAADDKQINYLAKLLGDQSTVGGRSPSINQMVDMLYAMFDNPDSTLNTALGTGGTDPAGTQDTINQVLQFIPLLGEFTGNQRFSRLLGKQAQNIAQDYMRQTANGQAKGSFMDYFRNNFLT